MPPLLMRLRTASRATHRLSAASATVTLANTISAPDYPALPTLSLDVADLSEGQTKPS
jgi:hypothetical protein